MLIILLYYLYCHTPWILGAYIFLIWIASWPREIYYEE